MTIDTKDMPGAARVTTCRCGNKIVMLTNAGKFRKRRRAGEQQKLADAYGAFKGHYARDGRELCPNCK